MDTLYSNELKSIVIADNILEGSKNILKENCLTVQHFDYQCLHKRNQANSIYGLSEQVILKFTVRVNSPRHAAVFYQYLNTNAHYPFSFLFNATFNAAKRVDNYEDGMVVDAFVVHTEESFNTQTKGQSNEEQILLNVTLQVRSVTYLGIEKNLTNTFIQ